MNSLIGNRRELAGIIICVASAMVFGLYPPAARVAYQEGANITLVVIFTAFCRLGGLYAMALLKGLKPFRKFSEYKTSLYTGLFQAASIIGVLGGSYFMPGAVVIIIIFTYSLLLLLFSAWRGEMKLNAANITSTIAALTGLAMVLNIGSYGLSYPAAGIALAFLGMFSTFARTYLFGRQSKSRHPLVIGAETFVVACCLLLLTALWEMPDAPGSSLGFLMLFISAISLTLGSFGMFYGIAYLGSYKFSMIMKLEPAFTTLFGVLIAGDNLSISQYSGIALVVCSLAALQIFDRQIQR